MTLKTQRVAVLLTALVPLFVAMDARCEKLEGPRPISRAEAAAVEAAVDFLSRGPEAVYDRLAPESPLRTLSKPDALAEIEVRTGPAAGAVWNLQTIVPSLADHSAIFDVEYPSGIDDVIELNLVEHDGAYQILMLRSLAEPSPYALRTSWMRADEPTATNSEEHTSLLRYFPVIGGLIAVLAVLSLALLRTRLGYGRLMAFVAIAACLGALHLVRSQLEVIAARSSVDASRSTPAIDRLGALLEQRRALASGVQMPRHDAIDKNVDRVAQIWKAQVDLRDFRLGEAMEILGRFRVSSDRPMVALLHARLAASVHDEVTSSLAYERAMRLGPGRDELWFETAQWLYALGFEERALGYLSRLPEMGSRNEDVYYGLASFAGAKSRNLEATAFLRTAWRLEPVPRTEIIATPALTAVMRIQEAKDIIPISSPVEPRFRTPGNPALYIDLPDESDVVVTGSSLSITFGDGRSLTADGGAVLVDSSASVVDAVSIERRNQARSLDDFERLLAYRGSQSALAHPAVRARFLQTAEALAEEDRWEDVERLTASLSTEADNVPPDLLFLRGSALRRMHRESEAKRLLSEIFASPSMERRTDPRILYQLGEMLASMELYAPAIRTLERVDAMMDDVSLDDRIRQLSMNQRLAERYSELESPNFIYHYPDDIGSDDIERLSVVMEAELARLRRIIPLTEFRTTTVNIVWWNEFRSTYTGSDHILGFYDGKITLPLAGVSRLNPGVVALMTHELAHAVVAQATDDRAPAWIQEGLAQRMEMVPYHSNAFNMYERDRLLPLSLLNAVLSDSVDVDLVGQAYITSQTFVRFLEAKHGAKVIPALLALIREGETAAEALRRLTGTQKDELEMAFREWGSKETRVFENRGLIRYDTGGNSRPAARFTGRPSGGK